MPLKRSCYRLYIPHGWWITCCCMPAAMIMLVLVGLVILRGL
jgi:hypothetical protein